MRRSVRIILWAALAPVAFVLIALGLAVASPVLLVLAIRERMRCRLLLLRRSGSLFLLCTSRRNWYDFLRNNVIPVLPDTIQVVWHRPRLDPMYDLLRQCLSRAGVFRVSKPCLVFVTRHTLLARSLNGRLQGLKTSAKVSDAVRTTCLRIVRETEEELRAIGRR